MKNSDALGSRILGKAGKKITQRDMELLLTKTGTDMGNLRMEMEKLISYTEGRDVVTAEDIEEICTTQTTNRIFDMVRAVTEKIRSVHWNFIMIC